MDHLGLKCKIILDKPDPVYHVGQNVSGKLAISSSSSEIVRAIYVECRAVGTVQWIATEHVRKIPNKSKYVVQTVEIEYKNEELYHAERLRVFQGGSDDILEHGDRVFEFNLTLPREAPTSYEGDHGKIRYSVNAIVEKPWKSEQKATCAINVIKNLDLNANPHLSEPISISKSRAFRFLFWPSGTVNVTLSLPAASAAPGDTLLPTLKIENLTRVHISDIELSFKKREIYKATENNKVKTVIKSLASKKLGRILSRQSQTFEEEALLLPVMSASDLTNCNIMKVDYFLEVNVIPPGFHFRFNVRLPVVLGSVPLRQDSDAAVGQNDPHIGWNINTPSLIVDQLPNYRDLPPPTYEEAILGYGDSTSAPSSVPD